jgi:hypothetical protein
VEEQEYDLVESSEKLASMAADHVEWEMVPSGRAMVMVPCHRTVDEEA